MGWRIELPFRVKSTCSVREDGKYVLAMDEQVCLNTIDLVNKQLMKCMHKGPSRTSDSVEMNCCAIRSHRQQTAPQVNRVHEGFLNNNA